MALNHEQILLLQKYQKMLSQLEKIMLVSVNEDQKKRVNRDIQKYRNLVLSISPDGIPDNIHVVRAAPVDKKPNKKENKDKNKKDEPIYAITRENILSNLVIMKISPHSNDPEINFIATLITTLETEYVPILGDSHIKFDFSHVTEKDNMLKHLENIRRTMKVLSETIEEYAQSDKQDFKEQLGRMKNKQGRIFISEAGELFKNFRDFITKVFNSIADGTGIIMNIDDTIHFNPRFEKATVLEGKSIKEAVRMFVEFTHAAIDSINVPGKFK
ncbi:MAG: hypothetical protein KDK36_02060 [Leptospiraceae bacterium]|nr:hypothetical protein [Leptospiraceae bacterium]